MAIIPPITGNGILSELIIIGIIALVLFIVLKLGKALFKLIFGIIINSVVGVILLLLLNYLFGFGIPLSIGVFVPIAIFGLPATGAIVLLKILGAVTFM